MIKLRGLLLTATLTLAASGLASAANIVQTFSLPTGLINGTNTSWTQSVGINTFDTTTGTLEYIEILSSLADTASAGATDITGNSGGDSYTIAATTTLTLTDPSTALLVAPSSTVSSTYLNQSQGDVMAVSTGGTVSSTAFWAVDTNTTNDPGYASCFFLTAQPGCLAFSSGAGSPANPLDYLAYETSGIQSLSLTANAASTGSFGGSSFGSAFASGTASVNVSVIYNYTAAVVTTPTTPEPATMALFGSGLVAVGLLRRRFKKA